MSTLTEWLRLEEGTPPDVAVSIAARLVSAAALEVRGGRPVVTACAAEPLPDGVIVPGLSGENVRDSATALGTLGRVLDRVGKPGRVGLVIPDQAARVTQVVLQQPPVGAADLEQVLRWQVKKSVPFAIEEAQVSYARGAVTSQGHEFLVTVALRSVVEAYEGLCVQLGAHPGLVDLSTTSVANAVMAGGRAPAGDWLLVHVSSDAVALAVLRGSHAAFVRSQRWDGASLGDLVHQTAMFYEDRLAGNGFERVVLSGAVSAGLSADVEQVCREIGAHVGGAVEVVDVRDAVGLADRITPSASLLDTLPPLVGLLLARHVGRVEVGV